jgi:hypothetical protein
VRWTQRTLYNASTQAKQLAKRDHSLIMTKNDRHFLPVGDIWTFKRPKYCILRLEHTARYMKSRIKPDKLANAVIRSILSTNDRNFHPVGDIATFKGPNDCILCAEHRARCTMRRHTQNNSQNAVIRSILSKNDRHFLPVGDIWTFKRPKYCILRLEHTARCIKSRIKPQNVARRGHLFDFVQKWP